ncbi:NADPH-dependent FMN reductase [Candidatus Nitrosopumilus sediminis]|uniref:NADPH-dependent FMN reductase n=1 Tax=Candidatus Nitrosopumilus sediminis TaxID=1229909 RepID=K0BD67_9ARCH|nr:NAD(P)H-dependent oxidoreductase [Candidatus Nitrosopumilus sediminis]AFS83012.1 NADPH-dependent FMN reductase [Candidatus Nitrosopumilus sediminis]
MKPKILAFAGSTRTDSFNKKLIRIAVSGASDAGADVTTIDLRDFQMPLYDGDLEQNEGLPQNVQKLKELMLSHQGFLISAPEYNSSITGVLKNTIDWTSRQSENETPLACYKGKVAGIMSASPGGLGGLRGLVHVRAILENMGVLVIPEQIAVSAAHEAFDVDNLLKDKKQEEKVKKIGANLTKILAKLSN